MFYKLNFSLKRNIDILLLDGNYAKLKFKHRIDCVCLKNKEIYFFPFIKTIFQKLNIFKNTRNLKDQYFINFIKHLNPKISIGHEINPKIFMVKMFFPEKKTIIYQLNNYYDMYKEIVKKIINKNKRLSNLKIKDFYKSDYFILKNLESKKYLNFMKTKFVISGSVKNNEINTIKFKKKKYDIMFISIFRKKIKGVQNTSVYNCQHMLAGDGEAFYIAEVIGNLAKKKNLKVCVALSSLREEKRGNINFSDEIQFYKNSIKKFHVEKKLNSYELAEKSNVIINVNSSLGTDLLGRGHKVLFLNPTHFFGAPIMEPFIKKNKHDGYCWHYGNDSKKIEAKIVKAIKTTTRQWNKNNILKNKFVFDNNNSKLKNIINQILKKN